jgi:hypothetical protein
MKELSNKGERFLIKWENRRKNKWRYILINGGVYYGLSAAIIAFLIHSGFKLENMQLSWFIRYAFIFMISGIFVVLRQFNQTDRIYLSLTDDSEIINGLGTLKAGGIWSFENLKICSENEDILTIQNDLFWFDEKKPSKGNINKCYKMVCEDFNRLKKNTDFDSYVRNKKVKIRIVDNSGGSMPLFVKEIQDQ